MQETTASAGVPGGDPPRLAFGALLREAEQVVDAASLLSTSELSTVTERMRTVLGELIPIVEAMALRCPNGTSTQAIALTGVGEARRRLDAGQRSLSAERYAERTARSVVAMCGMVGRLSASGLVGAGFVEPWTPPNRGRLELVSCGQAWDAVKVPSRIAQSVLTRLGEATGAVIEDPPGHVWYWLVKPGTGNSWRMRDVECLGAAAYLVVPPADRTEGLGVRWRVALSPEQYLTEAKDLYEALTAEWGS